MQVLKKIETFNITKVQINKKKKDITWVWNVLVNDYIKIYLIFESGYS